MDILPHSNKKKLKKQTEHSLFFEFYHEFLQNFISPQTKRAYLNDVAAFLNFLQQTQQTISHPGDIQAKQFQAYRDFLLEKKFSSATINRRLVCLRSFLKYCLATGIISLNPLDAVRLPKVATENPTQAFDDHEVVKMISAPDVRTGQGNLHRLILVLLFHLGLRRSELTHLQLKDFYQDRNHLVLKIKGKGQKIRELPVSNYVLHEVNCYLERLNQLFHLTLEPSDYLIQTKGKKLNQSPCHGSTVYRIVERYCKFLNINKKVGAHSCRATVISHLLDTQKSTMRDVAHFAGHSNILTTQRYDKKRKGLNDSAAYQVEYRDKSKESA